MTEFTHLDSQGHAHRVDVGTKAETELQAIAEAYVFMVPEILKLIT